jgi:hypothetical protein
MKLPGEQVRTFERDGYLVAKGCLGNFDNHPKAHIQRRMFQLGAVPPIFSLLSS